MSFNPRAHAGRDPNERTTNDKTDGFNPRAHAGRDEQCREGEWRTLEVSIHAPTRGATKSIFSLSTSIRFQSTRPRGARRIYATYRL